MSYLKENFSKFKPVVRRYGNGRLAVEYMIASDVMPGMNESACVATINVPDAPVGDNEVIIKDYSENEGIYKLMLAAGHIGPKTREVESGFITAPVCELLLSIPAL